MSYSHKLLNTKICAIIILLRIKIIGALKLVPSPPIVLQ